MFFKNELGKFIKRKYPTSEDHYDVELTPDELKVLTRLDEDFEIWPIAEEQFNYYVRVGPGYVTYGHVVLHKNKQVLYFGESCDHLAETSGHFSPPLTKVINVMLQAAIRLDRQSIMGSVIFRAFQNRDDAYHLETLLIDKAIRLFVKEPESLVLMNNSKVYTTGPLIRLLDSAANEAICVAMKTGVPPVGVWPDYDYLVHRFRAKQYQGSKKRKVDSE
ncbi:hypothetical protein AKO1_002760 [Acrasis kona]|uniref:Uncharacterized protein n=1 Tax=Acrasis kona TaxID=1008807 RepID=A0AAW2YM47_9EUKA